MLDISDKTDGLPPPGGQLPSTEYNDHKNENQALVETSGQTLDILKTPAQVPRAAFIYGTAAASVQDSGSDNTIILVPLTGLNGLKVPDVYVQFEGSIIEFTKVASNSSSAVTVNIGQTTGTVLGAKDLKKHNGNALDIGEVVGRCRIIWNNSSDEWRLISTHENAFTTQMKGYKNGVTLIDDGGTLKVSPGNFQWQKPDGSFENVRIMTEKTVLNEATVANSFIYTVYHDLTDPTIIKVDNAERVAEPVGAAPIQTAWTTLINGNGAQSEWDPLSNSLKVFSDSSRILGFILKDSGGNWDFEEYCNFYNGSDCQGRNLIGSWDRQSGNQNVHRYDHNTVLTTTSATGQPYIAYYVALTYIYPVKWVAPTVQNDLDGTLTWIRAGNWAATGALDGPAKLDQLTAIAFSDVNTATGRFSYRVSGPFKL